MAFSTHSSITRITSIRLLIIIATLHSFETHQMNVKTIFLNDELKEKKL